MKTFYVYIMGSKSGMQYVGMTRDASSAINREKQIKAWKLEKKVALIDSINSAWNDLSEDWYN
jgi:putative endonuclease